MKTSNGYTPKKGRPTPRQVKQRKKRDVLDDRPLHVLYARAAARSGFTAQVLPRRPSVSKKRRAWAALLDFLTPTDVADKRPHRGA